MIEFEMIKLLKRNSYKSKNFVYALKIDWLLDFNFTT